MAPWRVALAVVLCAAVWGVPAAPELAPAPWNGSSRPTTGPQPQATATQAAKMSLFHKVLTAAKDLVSPFWDDPSPSTGSPAAPSSATTRAGRLLARTPTRTQALHGGLSGASAEIRFHLRILNEHFSAAPEPLSYVPGSPIHVEASVEASWGVPPRIYVDECYGARAKRLSRARRLYVLVNEHGCLRGGGLDAAAWRRPEESALQFTVPAFLLAADAEEEVYIHCQLAAWGPGSRARRASKSCYYNRTALSWQDLEDPSQDWKCSCCTSHCPADPAPPGPRALVGEGLLHRTVAGPVAVHQAQAPWYEERCRSLKHLLLVGVAFAGSCLVGALFVGGALGLGLAWLRLWRRGAGGRLRERKEYPFHTELQTVVSALGAAEPERESGADGTSSAEAAEKA
ncbi:uncharacterized protein LOC142818455 [Pelodiscus sinensis]|uniref:uncharacterized protein LOC142818455 n=1 Tax=Pelodiscus sinensis TaxID=13735 RepID=UPI003F6C617C